MNRPIVVLDPGHGGHDSGAVGYGLKEKDIVLDLALMIGPILEKQGIKVIYTRTTDVFITLAERANIANRANADLFISLHANAGGGVTANGVEIFSHPTSKKGMELSKDILSEILTANIFKVNRGNKTANFAVLRRTKMAAALTETGFVDHKGDAEILRTKRKEIALSIAKGILRNLNMAMKKEQWYRVRATWEDKDSQKGAYTDLEGAIAMAKELKLNVYDENGREVYASVKKEHWAQKHFDNLNKKGITISEKRFDDEPTRGELFYLLDEITDVKKK